MSVEWELWGRLAHAGVARRQEIAGEWTLADLYAAHLTLDYTEECQAIANEPEPGK